MDTNTASPPAGPLPEVPLWVIRKIEYAIERLGAITESLDWTADTIASKAVLSLSKQLKDLKDTLEDTIERTK